MVKHVRSENLPERASAGPRLVIRGRLLFARLWRNLTARLGNSYRPERHYMRGPGPKWHERNSDDLNGESSGANARQQLGVLNG